jgi:DNA replication protein DnaC
MEDATSLQESLDKLLAAPAANPEEEAAREQADQEQRRQQELARRGIEWERFVSLVGQRYAGCTAKTFETATDAQRKALAELRDYARDFQANAEVGKNVILFGPTGTGKDHLAVALARHVLLGTGVSVDFITGMDLYARMRKAMGDDESEDRVLDRFKAAGVLLLSDPLPPSGPLTEYQTTVLYRLVDSRYRRLAPIWVTLNVRDGAEAAARLGTAVYDRLRHNALAIWCNWSSYRAPRRSEA